MINPQDKDYQELKVEYFENFNLFFDHLLNIGSRKNLWHYTDLTGMEGITTHKYLLLTKYNYLADPSEYRLGFERFLHQLAQENLHKNTALKSIYNFLNLIKEKTFDVSNTDDGLLPALYVASFCERKDFPPLWRKYGDNGNGYAIEFSTSLFSEQYDPCPNAKKTGGYIDYDEATITQKFNTIIQHVKNHSYAVDTEAKCQAIIFALLTLLLSSFIPFIKGKEYKKEEQEYRIVTIDAPSLLPDPCKKTIYSKPRAILHLNPLHIVSIMIGPKNDFSSREKNLRSFLDSIGLKHVKIKKSARA